MFKTVFKKFKNVFKKVLRSQKVICWKVFKKEFLKKCQKSFFYKKNIEEQPTHPLVWKKIHKRI